MTNETALEEIVRKILLEGDPLVCRGNPMGLAFSGMFVHLEADELLAAVKIVNKIRAEASKPS